MHTILQAQLTAISKAGAWGNVDKPQQDRAFLLVAPSLAVGCEWVFGLAAVWAYSCQAHLHTLGEAAHKLILLADKGLDWLYAFVWMNNAMSHTLLSSEGHIGPMKDRVPSMNACGCFPVTGMKVLQGKSWVVCPKGLNGELKALQFDFQELPLSNVAAVDEPTWDQPMIEVGLSEVEPQDIMTNLQVPNVTPVPPPFLAAVTEPLHDITMAINLHIEGALEWLQQTSPTTSTPISPT